VGVGRLRSAVAALQGDGETDGRGPVTVARALTSSWSTVSRNENSRSCSASNAARERSVVRGASDVDGISKPCPW
jgi:hypothetical protein